MQLHQAHDLGMQTDRKLLPGMWEVVARLQSGPDGNATQSINRTRSGRRKEMYSPVAANKVE